MIKTIAHLEIYIFVNYIDLQNIDKYLKLYKQLKDLKPDVIYIGGDVFTENLIHHQKKLEWLQTSLELCKILRLSYQ